MTPDDRGIEAALRRLYEVLSAGDADALPDLVTGELEAFVGVGIDGDAEVGRVWLEGFQAELRDGGAFPRVPGERPRCVAHGDVGWFADRPTLRLPDGSELRPRLTGVMRREEGAWRLVSLHASLPPDGPGTDASPDEG